MSIPHMPISRIKNLSSMAPPTMAWRSRAVFLVALHSRITNFFMRRAHRIHGGGAASKWACCGPTAAHHSVFRLWSVCLSYNKQYFQRTEPMSAARSFRPRKNVQHHPKCESWSATESAPPGRCIVAQLKWNFSMLRNNGSSPFRQIWEIEEPDEKNLSCGLKLKKYTDPKLVYN